MKQSETYLDNKKHSASWLTNHSENLKPELNKPKWFEEMIKNSIDETKETIVQSKENDNLFDLNTKVPAKLKENKMSANQIYSKHRNTLNILQTENQNFLNTFSKSAKLYTEKDIFVNQLINDLEKADDTKFENKNSKKDQIKNELIDLKSSEKFLDKSTDKLTEILNDNLNEKSVDDSIEEDFIIPNSPEGKRLTIVLKNNWGDENWIGLNGIEIFDLKTFKCITNIKCLTNLDTLPEKLFDGTYRTHDEDHIWKCKFDKNTKEIELKFEFESIQQIGLIRIWNFNKSRIYSYIGVKDMIILLDDVKIFDGQIQKAAGELKSSLDKFGDTILYTIDENNLEQISKNDTSFQELLAIN